MRLHYSGTKKKELSGRKGTSGSPALGLVVVVVVVGGLNCPKKGYMCVCKRQREIKRETVCAREKNTDMS